MRQAFVELWIRTLTKFDLCTLIEEVKRGDTTARERAVCFVNSESFGIWHNRARAKLCRHFKNHPPMDNERDQMVKVVVGRLISGRFAQQFKDQLSMAIRFAPSQLQQAALVAQGSDREYVRNYSAWVLRKLQSTSIS